MKTVSATIFASKVCQTLKPFEDSFASKCMIAVNSALFISSISINSSSTGISFASGLGPCPSNI